MEEKNDGDKNIDDFMLPGFRFHPTDEELVGFYLKRKLQQRSLPIELIKQLDIYKYDPWDLPKLASTGEKEWYFYCPRDRKYRNSTRPNRVTGSGFWKATGTDRPIYSSDGTKCIGLKKSLVFYRGRAAKGLKTDWMMHEFRLPSTSDGAPPPKNVFDKTLPPIDSWAICRIFKKANSMAQRALWHSWAGEASLSETTTSLPDGFTNGTHHNQFNSTTETELQQQANNFTALNIPSCKTIFNNNNDYFPSNFLISSAEEISGCTTKNTNIDLNSMLFKLSPAFEPLHQFNGYSSASTSQLVVVQESLSAENEQGGLMNNQNAANIIQNTWGNNIRSMGFPFSLPEDSWDSPPACPSEISSTTYSTDKCYA